MNNEVKRRIRIELKLPEASTTLLMMCKLHTLAPEYFSSHQGSYFYDEGHLTQAEVVLGMLQCIHLSVLIGTKIRIKDIFSDDDASKSFITTTDNISRIRIQNRGPDMRLYFAEDAHQEWVIHNDKKNSETLLENAMALLNKFMVLLQTRGIDIFHVALVVSNCVAEKRPIEATINTLTQDLFSYMSPYDAIGNIRHRCHDLRYQIMLNLQL